MVYGYPYYNTQGVQQNVQNNSIIWVQGIAGAKSYLVAPNNTVQLWDSEAQTIYLKSADASGMPSMKVLDYTIREAETPNTPLQAPSNTPVVEYATKDDLTALKGEIIEMVREEMKV